MGDILFLAHRVPYPPDRGDKIRGFHLLRFLAQRKPVHLVAFADDARDMAQRDAIGAVCDDRAIVPRSKSRLVAAFQALLGGRPVSLAAFDDRALHRAVAAMLERHPIDTIYVFSSQMAQYLPARPRQRVIMDFVDMDSAKFQAYGAASRGPVGWMLRREARLLRAYETAVASHADANLFVSAAEAELFRSTTGAERVEVVENGIDTIVFDPRAAFERIAIGAPLIVFTGQMNYRPNIEAVTWFADAILPLIRARHPHARFAIVGRAPVESVRALATRAGVTVTGEVADVRGWLAAAAVVVAPLKLARGIQNKVLEAMAMECAVVASTAAAEGIDHAGTVRAGATAEEISSYVIALLDDPDIARELGRAARLQVETRYGWDVRLAPLDTLLDTPVEAASRRHAA